MGLHPTEVERFTSDLQDHIEDVTTFWISSDELVEVLRRLTDDGHREIPVFGA